MHEQDSTTETSDEDAKSDSVKSISFWTCPTCELKLPMTTSTCPQDDTPQDVTGQLKDLFSSNYEFIGTIGTGGMSVIYKARQTLLDKIVAIKMLHSHLLNESSIMRFQQEAKAASRLKHPNVIAVHDFGVTKLGQPYMVMDFIDGKTLADLIKERVAIPLPEAMDIFLAVVNALEHAHEHNLLHRDLKPSNIMLRETVDGYEVFLVDFGIAKILDREFGGVAHQLTVTGEVMGSPLYMSPEQCMGKKVDQRSDIYSLGCILYEAVVGVPPHRGDTMIETIFKHLNEAAIPLHEVRPDIVFPDAFEALVMQLLETNPEDRVQTVSEVKKRLQDIQAGALAGKLGAKKSDSALKFPRSKIIYSICVLTFVIGLVSLAVAMGKLQEARQVEQQTDERMADVYTAAAATAEKQRNSAHQPLSRLSTNDQQAFLQNTLVSDEDLQLLLRLPKLRLVDLTETPVTDSALETLLKIHSLAVLSVRGTQMTAAGIAALGSLTNLSFLNISDTDADDAAVLAVSKLPRLDSLNLRSTHITDNGLAYLKNAKNLLSLDISGTRVTNVGMATLGQMKKMDFLAMWDVDVTPGGIEQLCRCKTLRTLSLSRLQLSQGDLAGLGTLEHLQELELFHISNLKDEDLKYLVHLKSLTKLHIEDCPLTDDCAAYIAQMSNLESLYLNRTKVTSQFLFKIANLKKLKYLRLQNTQLDDLGMKALANFPGLEELGIAGTAVSDAGVRELDSLSRLRVVGISFCPNISLQAMSAFRKAHHGATMPTHYLETIACPLN